MQSGEDDWAIYGAPLQELVEWPAGAVGLSPLVPGTEDLAGIAPETLAGIVIAAPPGTLERRSVLALALRALRPGAALTALAAKDKGGLRIASELRSFGCAVDETARRHHRICRVSRPRELQGLPEAIAEGGLRRDPRLGLWTQPGVFSWDRPDPGSMLLCDNLPALSGSGADLGCGIGTLALAVLKSPAVATLDLIDIDRRAIEAARRNIQDPRVTIRWADVGGEGSHPASLDFVVMNPPFHGDGIENRALGQSFIRHAAARLRPGGMLYLTANRHLPYEEVLRPLFKTVAVRAEDARYKIIEARR